MKDAVTLDPKRRRVRKFTAGRKRAFVELLAAGHRPAGAAKAVGLSRQAAYSQRAADPGFAEAWSEALERQADLYEDALRRAAIDQKNIGGIIFGLKNLRPDRWKDRHETVVESRSVSLNITAQLSEATQAKVWEIAARAQKALPAPDEDEEPITGRFPHP